ncbi:MAG: dockerin type I domain-containing protein [Acutalibacteraceae bacterium]
MNHAYTLQELKAGNGLKAAVKDGNGYYTAVYLNSGNGNFTYSQLLQNVSCASGINGFYIQTSPIETNDSAVAFTALKYDGKTDIPAIEKQTVKLAFYTGASIAGANIDVTVADTGDMSQFNSAYSALSNYVKNYRPSDFKDYDEANGTSATYDVATAALAAGYQAKYSPLNQSTASTLASNFTKVPVTTEVASAHGEVATVPVQDAAELPENLRATAVTDWSLYYADEDMTKVYYTNVPLTDDDVTIGDDPNSGTENYQNLEVVKVDGTWYYKNSQAYATAWNTDSYDAPYAVDGAAKQGTYNQMKFDHFNDNGVLTSGDYTVKVLLTQKTIVNDGSENRALAMQARDKMRYAVDQCAQMLSVTVAGQIFTKVSTVRDGMTDANFNLPEYQKMVSVAKDAEGMYAADIYLKSDESKTVLATCGWNQIDQTIADLASKNGNDAADYTYAFSTSTSSLQIEEAIRMFNLYMGTVTERGYIGDKVEAEVSHASGSAYSAMTTTWTDSGKVDADGNAIKNAAIATTATSAKYGAVEGGKLVNKGEKVYTDESWTNYVNALAAAVDVATTGNGDYAHKDAATYVPADKDNYTANLSACFTAYKNLVDAENSLEETTTAPSEGFAVTGKVLALANTKGELASEKFTVIGCDVVINGETVATTGQDGTFTIPALANGTYTATLNYKYGYDRNITITVKDGNVDLGNLGMVVCNFNKDGYVNASDYAIYFAASNTKLGAAKYNASCDFNHDGYINATDYAVYYAFSNARLSNAIYG